MLSGRQEENLTRTLATILILVVITTLLALSSQAIAQEGEDGHATLDTDQMVVGGGGAITVSGTGYVSCAGQTVTIGLVFRRTTATGYEPFATASHMGAQQTSVDANGDFRASLQSPAEFPGWLGYVAMQGTCVKLAPQRLLASVSAVVALGSSAAQQLGITSTSGAVVTVPAAEIRSVPILPDDEVKDPYRKLDPVVLLGSSSQQCAVAHAGDIDTAGDIVIRAADCGAGSSSRIAVGSRKTVLQSAALIRTGFAVPAALVFPPPDTGGEATAAAPAAPNTGSGSIQVLGTPPRTRDDGATWGLRLIVSLVFVVTLTSAAYALRRGRRVKGES